MNKTHASKAQRVAAAVVAAAVFAAGLMTATAASAGSPFDNKMSSVIATVKADPNYKAIPMTGSDRSWFYSQCESLWKKQITKEQFVAAGAKQFPGYEASFSTLADQLSS